MNPPVFIMGAPRSGTTLLLDLMSAHPDFAWISGLQNRDPAILDWSEKNRLYDLPLVGGLLFKQRYRFNRLPSPVEPWAFWTHYLPDFRAVQQTTRPQNPVAADLQEADAERARVITREVCRRTGKQVLLSKYTDFPRFSYLRKVFPGARFIHVVRDGRAVTASYARRVEKGEFAEWEHREDWIKAWPSAWQEEWREIPQSPLSLCAYLWKLFMQDIFEEAKTLPKEQYYEFKYEDFISDPRSGMQQLLDFCELKPSRRLTRYIRSRDIRDMNDKWRSDLNDEDKELLDRIIREKQLRETFVG